MNLAEALTHANTPVFPAFLTDAATLDMERRKNEEAILLLADAWRSAPAGQESFSFDVVRNLADRNRELCDLYEGDELRNTEGSFISRRLSDADLVRGIARLQGRSEEEVARSAGPDCRDLAVAYAEAPVSGPVVGFDIETTGVDPERGYIINIGFAFMELGAGAAPHDGHAAYYTLPDVYESRGVPLERIHHITWPDIAGKPLFRKDERAQEALLSMFTTLPLVAHNAAFEDSWLMLHLNGYAEARKAGRISLVDTRDICRRLDPEVKMLPRESAPASLENWARRRGTLAADEVERHLGLDDVFLMLRTMLAEFDARGML